MLGYRETGHLDLVRATWFWIRFGCCNIPGPRFRSWRQAALLCTCHLEIYTSEPLRLGLDPCAFAFSCCVMIGLLTPTLF